MMVILQQDVPHLGRIGDVVKVRDGYGRNYLLPRGLAVIADSRNVRRLEHQKRQAAAKAARILAEARAAADRISQTAVSIKVQAGEDGRLFGAVTNRDIAEALAAEGVVVDRKAIDLPEPIKQMGVFNVPIHLGPEVDANIKVYVIQQ
ncbi:MAG: 50S ribosomal protein L9 [Deltaproteobacteria bacterium]|nr:MAG: 50S ribosomal protein L9 [Deltaproteobacteria bacterium]